jgi:hypothetical protein
MCSRAAWVRRGTVSTPGHGRMDVEGDSEGEGDVSARCRAFLGITSLSFSLCNALAHGRLPICKLRATGGSPREYRRQLGDQPEE